MHYSADLEREMPSVNTSLHFEIKTAELVTLQEELSSFFFRQNGSKEKVEDEKQLQIPPVNSFLLHSENYCVI